MANYDLVIFDMDGTLLNSGNAHKEMFERFFKLHFSELGDGDIIYKHRGKTILESLQIEGIDEATIDKIFLKLDEFYNLMAEDIICGLKFEPHAEELLKELKNGGIKTAMVTNSMAALANQIVAHNDIEFDVVMGAQPDTQDKQKYFDAIMKKTGTPKARTLYVGDAEVDIDVAVKSGIDSCIVYTPITWANSLEGLLDERTPDYLVKDIRRVRYIVTDSIAI